MSDGALREAADHVLRHCYGLTGHAVVDRVTSQPTREVWKVTSRGRTLAVKLDRAVDEGSRRGVESQDRVASTAPGVAPRVMRSLAGDLAVEHRGIRFVVAEWVDGGAPSSPADWAAVGRSLAQLHAVVRPDLPDFGVPYVAAIGELRQALVPELQTPEGEALFARAGSLPPASSCIIHGEPAASNVVVGAKATLIDWDQSGIGMAVLDLGFPLVHEFVMIDHTFRRAEAGAFYEAYRREAGELPADPSDVVSAALFWALRFTTFFDRDRRWQRVVHAAGREAELLAAVRGR